MKIPLNFSIRFFQCAFVGCLASSYGGLSPAYGAEDDKLLLHISKGHEVSINFREQETSGFVGCWIDAGQKGKQKKYIIRRGDDKYKMIQPSAKAFIYSGDVKNNTLEISYNFKNIQEFKNAPQWVNDQGGRPDNRLLDNMTVAVWPRYKKMSYSLRLVDKDQISGINHSYHVNYKLGSFEINSHEPQDKPVNWRRETLKISKLYISGADKAQQDSVDAARELLISATSEPGCDITRDRITALLYPDNNKDEAVEITLIESEVDSNEYFPKGSLYPVPPTSTSAAWARPYTRLTVIQKDSLRGASIKVERIANKDSRMDSLDEIYKDMQKNSGNVDVLKKQTKQSIEEEKLKRDKIREREAIAESHRLVRGARDLMKQVGQDLRDRENAKKAAAKKAATKKMVGGAGKGRGLPPVPGAGKGAAIAPVMNCPTTSPDPKCWTDKQLHDEIQRLEILYRRINGGEGVMIYKRYYKMSDGHLITRLESHETAEYGVPYDMTDQSRFIRRRAVIDALKQAKTNIEAILSSR